MQASMVDNVSVCGCYSLLLWMVLIILLIAERIRRSYFSNNED